MRRECFTCKHKIRKQLSPEIRKRMKEQAIANGEKFPRIPDGVYYCMLSNAKINQTDLACYKYEGHELLESIRLDMSKAIQKLINNE